MVKKIKRSGNRNTRAGVCVGVDKNRGNNNPLDTVPANVPANLDNNLDNNLDSNLLNTTQLVTLFCMFKDMGSITVKDLKKRLGYTKRIPNRRFVSYLRAILDGNSNYYVSDSNGGILFYAPNASTLVMRSIDLFNTANNFKGATLMDIYNKMFDSFGFAIPCRWIYKVLLSLFSCDWVSCSTYNPDLSDTTRWWNR